MEVTVRKYVYLKVMRELSFLEQQISVGGNPQKSTKLQNQTLPKQVKALIHSIEFSVQGSFFF